MNHSSLSSFPCLHQWSPIVTPPPLHPFPTSLPPFSSSLLSASDDVASASSKYYFLALDSWRSYKVSGWGFGGGVVCMFTRFVNRYRLLILMFTIICVHCPIPVLTAYMILSQWDFRAPYSAWFILRFTSSRRYKLTSGLCGHQECMWHTHIHAGTTLIHIRHLCKNKTRYFLTYCYYI